MLVAYAIQSALEKLFERGCLAGICSLRSPTIAFPTLLSWWLGPHSNSLPERFSEQVGSLYTKRAKIRLQWGCGLALHADFQFGLKQLCRHSVGEGVGSGTAKGGGALRASLSRNLRPCQQPLVRCIIVDVPHHGLLNSTF